MQDKKDLPAQPATDFGGLTMEWWAILLIVLAALIVGFFVLTFIVYWFNIDMKFIYKLYWKLSKHYDNIERDRDL